MIVLNDVHKGYDFDLDKLVTPKETIRSVRKKLKKTDLDILKAIVRVDKGRVGIPIHYSIYGKDALSIPGLPIQQGKGATKHQSKASALMELIERFSLFHFLRNSQNFIFEEYRNIRDKALPFDLVAKSVHDNSNESDRAKKIFSQIPQKWILATNLTRKNEILIPSDWFYTINEYNGSSAGNCQEEAICQGICELVERHVSSLVSLERIKTPAIKIESITDPVVLKMIEKYKKVGIKLYLSDLSLDIGIPTIGVLAYDPSTFPESSEIVWAAGTASNPQKALNRTLTEVAQFGRNFKNSPRYKQTVLTKFQNLEEATFITETDKKIDINELPDLSDRNMRIEIENLIAVLREVGMEVIAVDITHPLLEIPAFYNIIPGAHFGLRTRGTSVGYYTAALISKNEDLKTAISQLKKMDAIIPGKRYIRFFIGRCYIKMGDFQIALRYFQEALDLDSSDKGVPNISIIYHKIGICFRELGQYEEAINTLEKAKYYDCQNADIYNLLGICYFDLKEFDRALVCFDKVLGIEPGRAFVYAKIANIHEKTGNARKAANYYKTSLKIDPNITFAKERLKKLREKKHS